MGHVTHMTESRHKHECIVYHTCECVMSRVCIHRDTYLNESCVSWRVPWLIAHMTIYMWYHSCHTWLKQVRVCPIQVCVCLIQVCVCHYIRVPWLVTHLTHWSVCVSNSRIKCVCVIIYVWYDPWHTWLIQVGVCLIQVCVCHYIRVLWITTHMTHSRVCVSWLKWVTHMYKHSVPAQSYLARQY